MGKRTDNLIGGGIMLVLGVVVAFVTQPLFGVAMVLGGFALVVYALTQSEGSAKKTGSAE